MKVGKLGIAMCLAGLLICNSTLAKSTSVQDIQDLPSAKYHSVSSQSFDQNHWVYKTLKDISLKHGSIVNLSDKTFDGTRPLTRNEAAVLLVNLVGKIHQDNIKLNDAEQAKLEIVTEELQKDVDALTGRVATLETDVKSLKGTVSKIETNQKKTLKVNFGDDMYLNGGIIGSYTGVFKQGDVNKPTPNFNVGLIDLNLGGKLVPGIDYKAQFFPQTALDGATNDTSRTMMGDAYISTDFKKNKIYLGRTRIPIGNEGTRSPYALTFASRSQIARNLSNARDTGIKIARDEKFYNYYVGAYNGTRNVNVDNNSQLDIATWAGIKPLANFPKLGTLLVDGGYTKGSNVNSYDVVGAHIGYKFKKLGLDTEYATSSGIAGKLAADFTKRAQGLYVATTYDVTPKIQLAARYDLYDPNKNTINDQINEYTLGMNYFMNKNNVKLQLNYVYVDNYSYTNSSRIVLQSQFQTN